ncbi:phosphatase PAP2 family protein [Hymenobacter baengnokdamensis]|uniref:phosphatase PAP2 family protein n=1 Tax=Hymenobacter baengnokdamensis TaxID=2615203 RepID=UPI001246AF40|nr:phosphatase PAP2 family protein [Hymenobacter baengnokdamensis]
MISDRFLSVGRQLWPRLRSLVLGLVLGVLLPWLVFIRLAREVWEGEGLPGDHFILEFLHAHSGHTQDKLALLLAQLGGPIGASVLAGSLMLGMGLAHQRRAFAFFSLAVIGSEGLNIAAKYLVARARPDLWVSLTPLTSYSFPSGHSMAAAALSAALGFMLWRTRVRWLAVGLGCLWALVMGWSRLYLGVHYPSDVLAGWVGSVGWVGGLHLLFARQYRELRAAWGEARLYWHGAAAQTLARDDAAASIAPQQL